MVAVPTQLLHYFSVQVDETGVFCKISEYFRVLSSTAAILNLTAVTLERFVVIVYPYHSRSLCTLGNCRKVVTTVWVLSIFLAIPVIWTKVRTWLEVAPRPDWTVGRMCSPTTTPTAQISSPSPTAMILMIS